MKKLRSLTMDAAKKTVRGKFKPPTRAEQQFYKALKKVAQYSGHIVDTHVEPGAKIRKPAEMMEELRKYSERLGPWARRQSAKLLESVQKSNRRAYQQKSEVIGSALKANVGENGVLAVARALMEEQVNLIKSIPIEAGQRAQKIAFEAVLTGTRAAPDEDTIKELEKQLGVTTEVATSRAQLIAITETARATASINQARAMAVGSKQYRWHNSGDEAVRDAHRYYQGSRIQGKIFSWDNPPRLDDGTVGHPGTFPRCRCFAEPVFEEE